GGRALLRMPMMRKIWFAVSAVEWHASASIALEPDSAAGRNLKTAMAMLTASAATTTRMPPPFRSLTRSSYRIGDAAPQLVDAVAVGGGDGDHRQPEGALELVERRFALVLGQLVGL